MHDTRVKGTPLKYTKPLNTVNDTTQKFDS